MKPDFEEFDDYASESDSPRSRAMSWIILGVALSGFIALAWYAYQSGSDAVQDGQMVVIRADNVPIKEKPIDAGGEQFPHQDKSIYDTISPYHAEEKTKVEKLLPEAEEPVAVEIDNKTQDTKTWVNDKLKRESDAEEKIIAQLEKKAPEKEVADAKPAIQAEAPKPVPSPQPPAPKVEMPKPKPQNPAPAGVFKIQLGAYSSEAEAKQNWARISSKHAVILSGVPHSIQKAQVAGKIVYRLRISGYATADAAKQACAKLSASGQACFFAGK